MHEDLFLHPGILGQTMVAPQLYNVFQNAIVRDQLVANTVLAVLAMTMVLMRFILRRMRESRIWWDNVCWVFFVGIEL